METIIEEGIERAPQKEKIIPTRVWPILLNFLLERYSTTGIAAILALYLNTKLNFDPSISTAIYHINELLVYSFTIVGAIIADSWLGLYRTILWMTLVFSVGSSIVSFASVESLNLPIVALTITGLLISVVGVGMTRTNLMTFGMNQYTIPEHTNQLKTYFSLQMFVLKFGQLIGQLLIPIIRTEVHCFGQNDCYPLAFGSATVMMVIAAILLLSGKSLYIQKPTSGNMLVKVTKCMLVRVSMCVQMKIKNRKTTPKAHWLDYAESRFGAKLVNETKTVVSLLILFLPVPVYWAVSMQQGSRWVFLAKNLDGDLGFYTIKPDQMIVLKPFFEVITLPICDYLVYPLLEKIKIKTMLQRMTIGGMLAVVAFVIAALVELRSETNNISILWMIPQYWIMAFSEIFVFASIVTFTYTEAPARMKSVMLAFVFVAMAIGNLFVAFISGTKLFESQAVEFFFFAGILFMFMILFGYLASRYKPVEPITIN